MKPIHQAASVLTCVIVASTLILRAPLPATAQTIGVINRTEPIVLTVAPSYMRHHEEHSVVTASLMTEVGKPLANAEMLLRVDNFLELRARTDAQGIATFELPGELLEGGYDLRFRFVGNPNWQPATATSQLTMQPPLTPGLADVDANGAMTAVQRANIDVDVADAPANAPRGMVQVAGKPVALALRSPGMLPRGSVIPVRLTSLNGNEIGNAPVVLFVDHALEIDGMTDANGDARFQLPPELLEGDYRIRVVFTGKDEYGPAMQLAALRLHPASAHDTLPRPADANALTHLSAAAPALLSGISDWFVGVSATLPVWVKASLDPAEIVYLPAQSPASAPAPLNHRANGQDALAARQDVATSTHASRLMRESKTEAPSTDAPITPSPPGAGVTWAPGMVTWLAAVTGGLSLPAIAILLAIMTIGLVVSPAVMGRWRRAAPRRRAGWTGRSFSIPMPVWYVLRICSVGIALGTAVVLIVRPALGLRVFWGAFIPMVPLLFFVAPGLWRNICPMAALNQTPRMFKFSRGLTLPRWWQEYSFVIAVGLFLVLAASRKVIFNQNGPALALLILAALGTALLMGSLYKGKSGWCSSICPLLPVQRVYGQTPFVSVPHAHCQPCLGCTKNCYDLSPKYALLADFHDPEPSICRLSQGVCGTLSWLHSWFLPCAKSTGRRGMADLCGDDIHQPRESGILFPVGVADQSVRQQDFRVVRCNRAEYVLLV
ncbi:MAG: hypothetical protein IPK16_07145 [Anaerolineales bacterium]|nr:hypothetical protein [Anaerolineales bacterium]